MFTFTFTHFHLYPPSPFPFAISFAFIFPFTFQYLHVHLHSHISIFISINGIGDVIIHVFVKVPGRREGDCWVFRANTMVSNTSDGCRGQGVG